MNTLKINTTWWRICASILLVVGLSVGVTAASTVTDAVTHREATAEAWPWDGYDLNWSCVAGVSAFGFGVIASALAPPFGMKVLLMYSAAGVWGAWSTANDCAHAGLTKWPSRFQCMWNPVAGGDQAVNYYYPPTPCGSLYVGAGGGGGGGGSW